MCRKMCFMYFFKFFLLELTVSSHFGEFLGRGPISWLKRPRPLPDIKAQQVQGGKARNANGMKDNNCNPQN